MSSVTCFPCQKFLNDSHFSFDNWKKPERLTTHSKSEAHLLAMTKWMDSKATASNNNNILTQLQKKHESEVQDNRKYLQMLIESIAHLAKQNIAFRGHNEDRSKLTELSDQNRGNFLETLNLMSNHSPFLKVRLEKQLKNKSFKQWTSDKFQNKLIALIADYTERKIIDEVKNETSGESFIGVIADETSDISRVEQISLVISYVDSLGQKRESFLKFIMTDKTDGETLFNKITDEMKAAGLDLSKVVGLGFDGAANMNGVNKGVATRFKECSPLAQYVHCYAHLLSLATKDTLSDIPLLRNTLGTMLELYKFIEGSPHRHAVFMKNGDFVTTLKSLCVTRWTAHESSRKGIEKELSTIIKTLNEECQERNAEVSSKARSLLKAVLDFDFLFGLELLKLILPHTSSSSSSVQSVSIDVRTVKVNADLTVKTLEGCRNDESFNLIWLKTSEKCAQVKELIEEEVDDDYIEFEEAKLPNCKPSRRRQNLLGESSDGNYEFSDIKTYHRITNFFPALDKVIFELRSRFAENENVVLCSLEEIICESNPEDKHFECVSEFYSLDIDLLKAQHQLLKHFKSQYVTSQVSVPDMFELLIE